MCPSSVNDHSKNKVSPQIEQFPFVCDRAQTQKGRHVGKQSSSSKWRDEDRPVWKCLFGEMGQDNFCRHAAKHQGHCEAEKNEMVLLKNEGVGASEPCHCACREDDHGRPFQKQRCHVLASRLPCNVYIIDTCRPMGDAESTEYDWNPKVSNGGVRLNEVGEGGKNRDYRLLPDIRTMNARNDHHGHCNDETLYTSVSYVLKEKLRGSYQSAH